MKESYFDVSCPRQPSITGKESITVCFERNFRKLPCEKKVLFGIKKPALEKNFNGIIVVVVPMCVV